MSIDYSKHKLGDILSIHVCNDCQYRQTNAMMLPAESGNASLWCNVCDHYNIGSTRLVQIGDWCSLRVLPLDYAENALSAGSGCWKELPIGRPR